MKEIFKESMWITIVLSFVYMNKVSADSWTTKTPMPTERYGLQIGVVYDKIYAIGGYRDYAILSVNEMYSPDLNVQEIPLNLPKLKKRILKIYPNPASGKFSVFISSNKSGENEIFISDITGRKEKIFKGFIPKGNYKLEFEIKNKNGIYFIIFGEDKEKIVLF